MHAAVPAGLLVCCFAVPSLSAQSVPAGRVGPRLVLSLATEIALARSAAPPEVSAGARVWAWTPDGYIVADSGRTDVACLVARSWPESLEPACYDREAAATILPMEIRRVELYHRGASPAAADADIGAGLLRGTFRLPARPAVVYMMSAAQRLVSDAGRPVGAWKPHLMIYAPFLTSDAVGHHGPMDGSAGVVFDSGGAAATLVVVVPAFVEPRRVTPETP